MSKFGIFKDGAKNILYKNYHPEPFELVIKSITAYKEPTPIHWRWKLRKLVQGYFWGVVFALLTTKYFRKKYLKFKEKRKVKKIKKALKKLEKA